MNCYRTAAADAVATNALARPDADVRTLFGTGHQAAYEALAIACIRKLSRLLVVGRDLSRTDAFVEWMRSSFLLAEAAAAEAAVRAADIIVTATTATEPLFEAEWAVQERTSPPWDRTPGANRNSPAIFFRALVSPAVFRNSRCGSASSSTRAPRQP